MITIQSQSCHECSCGLSFILPLQRPLHTWYVEARNAPATICGFTEPRVPPTCRRLPRDFALFPTAIGIHFHLTGVVHQTARSRPASLISLADDTLGGRVQNMSDWTHDFRTTSQIVRRDEFSGRNLRLSEKAPPPIAAFTTTRAARPYGQHRWHRATMEFVGFRTQPPLPRWLAPNSVCQWFHHSH